MRAVRRTVGVLLLWALAVPASAQGPVVRAILFYSPSCPHCHQVMTQDLPPLVERYGDSLLIAGVNTMTPGGEALYLATVRHFGIPRSNYGVPMMVVGDRVLVGALEIPDEFPGIVARGLEAGGIGWPTVPLLQQALAAQGLTGETRAAGQDAAAPRTPETRVADSAAQAAAPADPGPDEPAQREPGEAEEQAVGDSAQVVEATQQAAAGADREVAERPAEAVAGEPEADTPAAERAAEATPRRETPEPEVTDTGIAAAGGAATRSGEGVPSGGEEAESPTDRTPFRPGEAADEPTAPGAESGPGGGVVALDDGSASALSVALVRFRRDLVGNFFSVLVLLAMLAVLVVVVTGALRGSPRLPGWPVWAVPALAAAGLVAASYLSFVEVTETEAVCGPVGDCNTVQQSEYATILGFLPVGVAGLAGYVAMVAAWLVARAAGPDWGRLGAVALWGMALVGTLFSIYLTFLEPFVIGATCMWCLASAVTITGILLAATPMARAALEDTQRPGDVARP